MNRNDLIARGLYQRILRIVARSKKEDPARTLEKVDLLKDWFAEAVQAENRRRVLSKAEWN